MVYDCKSVCVGEVKEGVTLVVLFSFYKIYLFLGFYEKKKKEIYMSTNITVVVYC